jgi:hypothetical protein
MASSVNCGIVFANRNFEHVLHDNYESERRGNEDHQAVGPDLRCGDFTGPDRHDQQVLNGAALAFPDDRCADKENGQYGQAFQYR